MPLSPTPASSRAKKALEKKLEEKKKVNKLKTLAETRSAQRLKLFNGRLEKPEVMQELRELQLIPLVSRYYQFARKERTYPGRGD